MAAPEAAAAPSAVARAHRSRFAASRERDLDRLFAGFLGLAVYVLTMRLAIMTAAPQFIGFFPAAIYQDVLFMTAAGWTIFLLLALAAGSKRWKIFVAAGWAACFLLGACTSIHVVVYRLIRSPLTWRLIAISDRGGGAEPAIIEAVRSSIGVVLGGFLTIAAVSMVSILYAPNFVARSRRVFFSARADADSDLPGGGASGVQVVPVVSESRIESRTGNARIVNRCRAAGCFGLGSRGVPARLRAE